MSAASNSNPTHSGAPLIFIPLSAVITQIGMQKTYLYQSIRAGTFVPPIKLGNRAARFIASEVQAVQRAIAQGAQLEELRSTVQMLIAAR